MTKDNAAQYLPLVQALADGKTIQCRVATTENWLDITCPCFDSPDPSYYRIKPTRQKRTVWINVYPLHSGSGNAAIGGHITKEVADAAASNNRLACIETVLEWDE